MTPLPQPVIGLEQVNKDYRMGEETVRALRGIDLRVDANELIAIMGPLGSGKSTLINLLVCLGIPKSRGCWLVGREVARLSLSELARVRGGGIRFFYQTFKLFPRQSALRKVAPENTPTSEIVADEQSRPSGGSACATGWSIGPRNCRAASASGSRSRGPSCKTRRSSSQMHPPGTSTPAPATNKSSDFQLPARVWPDDRDPRPGRRRSLPSVGPSPRRPNRIRCGEGRPGPRTSPALAYGLPL